ncbi:hypothetical protein CV023_17565 [Brevibacterium sp. CCUG 69071]|nr:hypothetical protein [Brevibacterium sp. CCUG 69071]
MISTSTYQSLTPDFLWDMLMSTLRQFELLTTMLFADNFVTSNEMLAASAETAGPTANAIAAIAEMSARLMSFKVTPMRMSRQRMPESESLE